MSSLAPLLIYHLPHAFAYDAPNVNLLCFMSYSVRTDDRINVNICLNYSDVTQYNTSISV